MTWILTFSGIRVDPLKPDPNVINMVDIVHSLSHICRFTGHTSQFYSVAQHSLLVAKFCKPENQLWALLHDGPEAYLSDVAKPLKHTDEFAFYRELESAWMQAFCTRFGLEPEQPEEVGYWDLQMLHIEGRSLMHNMKDWDLPPEDPKLKSRMIRGASPDVAKAHYRAAIASAFKTRPNDAVGV